MATVYKSKVDTWILVVLVFAMAVCVFASVAVAFSGSPDTRWALFMTIGFGILLPLWLLVSTHYTLDSRILVVRSGPMKWRVPISEISSITPTHSVLSSPALSLDRLRIDYGRGRQLMISPSNREQFLKEIEVLRRATA